MTDRFGPLLMTAVSPVPPVINMMQTANSFLDLAIKVASLIAGICIAFWWVNKFWDKAPELYQKVRSLWRSKQ